MLHSTLILTIAAPAFALTHARRGPTSQKLFSKRSKTSKATGQHAIDSARTTEIQNALIKQGYLSGQPSGEWDAQTQSAMQKLQSDNGWQTKITPDSRAIIKLGLGPSQDSAPNASLSSTVNSQTADASSQNASAF
jgi:hypothetical protein